MGIERLGDRKRKSDELSEAGERHAERGRDQESRHSEVRRGEIKAIARAAFVEAVERATPLAERALEQGRDFIEGDSVKPLEKTAGEQEVHGKETGSLAEQTQRAGDAMSAAGDASIHADTGDAADAIGDIAAEGRQQAESDVEDSRRNRDQAGALRDSLNRNTKLS